MLEKHWSVLVGVRRRRNYKTSCAEAVHLFEDRSEARGIVGGISEPNPVRHTGNRGSDRRTPLMAAIEQI